MGRGDHRGAMYRNRACPLGVPPATDRTAAMTRRRLPLLAALTASALLAACGGGGGEGGGGGGSPPPPPPAPSSGPLRSDVVVQLRPGANVAALAERYTLTLVDQFGKRPIWRLRVAEGADADVAVAALRADDRVRFAERTIEGETPEGRRGSLWAIGSAAGEYTAQWAPQAIRLDAARDLSSGSGVRIAVLDTGVDLDHPALAPKLARRAGGSLLGRDFVDGDADPSEQGSRDDRGFGHGTHVAGLAALVAPGARLMPVRVLDAQGRGNTWVLAEALGWAVDPDGDPTTDDGAHVVNLSLGTLRRTELLKTVAELASCNFDDDDDDFQDPGFDDDRTRCGRGHAAVVTVAAGNSGSATEQQFPAAEDVKGVLSLAASTEADGLASFSNRGGWIRLAAPGAEVVSTVPGGGYGAWSGTSMAAPIAAGTVALVLATLPDGGDPGRAPQRQWTTELAAKRLTDFSAALCGASIRQLDARSAVEAVQAPDPTCP
jgi:Subtilase family